MTPAFLSAAGNEGPTNPSGLTEAVAMAQRSVEILIVEDNEADVFLTYTALRDAKITNTISVVTNGEDAIAYLKHKGKYAEAARPDIIFLDLNLPMMNGHEVLAVIKTDPNLRAIPVVVVSGSNAESDIARAYDEQVAAYIVKPASHEEYFTAIRAVKELWFHIVALPPKPAYV
jgi:two-component system, chemotaxis family, response regulator Rcp1